jgi:hypothetical protein
MTNGAAETYDNLAECLASIVFTFEPRARGLNLVQGVFSRTLLALAMAL